MITLDPPSIDSVATEGVVRTVCGYGRRGFFVEIGRNYELSIQFGSANYCRNRDEIGSDLGMQCPDAEIAVTTPDGGLLNLEFDTVIGWVKAADINGLIERLRDIDDLDDESIRQAIGLWNGQRKERVS